METTISSGNKSLSDNRFSKENVINFIKGKTGFNILVDFSIDYGEYNGGKWIRVDCKSINKLHKIAKALENDPYYERRISTRNTSIHISILEKPEIFEYLSLIKKFFTKLESSLGNYFIIETPAIIVATQSQIKIVLKFKNHKMVLFFIKKIKERCWSFSKYDDDILYLFMPRNQIEEFLTH